MKITNFKKNYGSAFKSLDDVADKLDSLQRRGNGHNRDYNQNENDNNHNDDFIMNENTGVYEYSLASPYDDVKLPDMNFVATLFAEHPDYGPNEVAGIIVHRIQMRHYFPDKFKSAALARGDEYLPDEMEEYLESKLDSIELERLRRQRARRAKIGTILNPRWDKQAGMFYFELDKEFENCDEPFTEEDYIALLRKEKDI